MDFAVIYGSQVHDHQGIKIGDNVKEPCQGSLATRAVGMSDWRKAFLINLIKMIH